MKLSRNSVCGAMVAALLAVHGQDVALDSEIKKQSYAIGSNMGTSLVREGVPIDLDSILLGMRHTLLEEDLLLSSDEVEGLLNAVRNDIMKRRQAKRAEAEKDRLAKGEEAKAAGEAFLANKRDEDGVVATESGLLYKVIREGEGESPARTDTVTVHYAGRLVDGTEFDSSLKRDRPARFSVSGVIKGWTEALLMMKPGAKWELYIPSDLAYGANGSAPKIPPHSALIFDVELLEVSKPKPKAAPQPVTSDIIKVPSAEELKKGAKIEVIPKDKIEEYRKKEAEAKKDGGE